jgi:hypothetical protein
MSILPSAFARLVPLVLLAVAVAGCGLVPVPAASPSGPLLTVTAQGGRCVEGVCQSVTVIEQDGRAHQLQPTAGELGQVPAVLLQPLGTLIRSTDFAAVRSRPFEDLCPIAYDGQELIYEFSTPSGVERVASCETEIDPSHPLFRAVDQALAAVRGEG